MTREPERERYVQLQGSHSNVSILFSVTDNLDLTVRNEWRRDSRPPEGVEENDYGISTGFTASFR